MKKLLLINLLVLTTFLGHAQYRGGIEAGANMMNANFAFLETLDTELSWGIRLGYVAEYGINENLFFKSGLLINQRGFKFGDERWAINALDLPINMGYAFALNDKNKWFFDGGLNLEYNTRAFTKIDDELVTIDIGSGEDDLKAFATGLNIGTGMEFNSKFKVRVNYYYGLTNLVRTPASEWKNQVIGVAMHFFFNKKKQ